MSDVLQKPATPPAHPDPSLSVQLSSTPRGARLARLLTDVQLREWGLPSDPALLIVAELAANAATHGRVPGRDFRLVLRLHADGVLRIEVTDTRGESLPEAQPPCADAESGRGLLLVDALAHRWGVTHDAFPRKTVWAELPLVHTTGGRNRTKSRRTHVPRTLARASEESGLSGFPVT
ncbi:ATP-binding protein [Streptomyces sp. NRRL F-5126]|uniref:ATP-binding protein n=1 Tax=Streptomyces sp. NRRL F-5126 TaxID=1463857 RepID=UPI001F26D47A|nr:ATP-binding protein [Streptomyces sp. NRRL F-5126]